MGPSRTRTLREGAPHARRRARARAGAALAIACLLAAAVLAIACGGEPPTGLVLITLDTTRADALGAYGQALPSSPRLDALAREGALFEQADTPVPSTLPAHASLLTGLEPYVHGVRSNIGYRLTEGVPTLAEILRARGFATHAEVAAVVVSRVTGLDRGFDGYGEPFVGRGRVDRVTEEAARRPGAAVTEGGIRFLEASAGKPFLLWLHYFDAHRPYPETEPLLAGIPNPYLAQVRRVDDEVGKVLDELSRLGLRDRTLVAVIGDHGEGRGEHGEDTHSFFVFESTLRVPFLLAGPGVPRGVRIATPVRAIDLMPTLLDLLGVPAPTGLSGVSLRPLLAEPDRDLRLTAYAESSEPAIIFGGDRLRSLRDGRLKYVHKLRPRLFDLEADPGERHDLSQERPEDLVRLRDLLAERLAAAPTPAGDSTREVDAAERARLRALGYVGGPEPAPDANDGESLELHGPDPRDMVLDFQRFAYAWGMLSAEQAAEAEPLFRQVVERQPRSAASVQGLLEAVRARGGSPGEQIEILRAAVAAQPEALGFRTQLASVLAAEGEVAAAEEELRALLAQTPCEAPARLLLASLHAQRRRFADELATLEPDAECPSSPLLDNALAFALATRPDASLRDGARALELAQRATAVEDASFADHLDTLAAAYAELGRFDEARAVQDRAIAYAEQQEAPAALLDGLRAHRERLERGLPIREP